MYHRVLPTMNILIETLTFEYNCKAHFLYLHNFALVLSMSLRQKQQADPVEKSLHLGVFQKHHIVMWPPTLCHKI